MAAAPHPYIPNAHAADDMLATMGTTMDALFADIPASVRLDRQLEIPPGRSESEVAREADRVFARNRPFPSFLGAGLQHHHVPVHVAHLVQRGEFLTAYTSYQPEVSQGMLQALYEYQSMMAELTGLECVNASQYDWATALGEAALMCMRLTRRDTVVLAGAVAPWRRSVLKNFLWGPGGRIVDVPAGPDGRVDPDAVAAVVDDSTACVYAENPNFLGVLETGIKRLCGIAHDADAKFVAGVDPWTLGVIEAPGAYGADVAVGEGSSLAGPPSFGGPGLGIFACRFDRKTVRQAPGRFVGRAENANGKLGYVLTLQAREQAIRRDKATSNICSNEALVAVAAGITLASLGPEGLREAGEACMRNARYLARRLGEVDGLTAPHLDAPFFNELTVRVEDGTVADLNRRLLDAGIMGGLDLGAHLDGFDNVALLCATERHTTEDIDVLAEALAEGGGR
ncbi:MAG: aminomethyl-transferring glycine dehydrogenase subunit GcvPA [Methanopyri archaeon]|nr:aminomethyl-transferring glycine dehydrogenase subunit GcvPA [Methanopyri archaeon]